MAPMADEWVNVGAAETLKAKPLHQILVGRTRLAVSFANGTFGVVSGVCNHASSRARGTRGSFIARQAWVSRGLKRMAFHGTRVRSGTAPSG